ncbi:hypothetical protein [Pedobacter immunditicola]|uniref:hypothetical protein n=1 Tax=Pedobacter immunditicola TaxID=3133440 RepID=UPI003095D22E
MPFIETITGLFESARTQTLLKLSEGNRNAYGVLYTIDSENNVSDYNMFTMASNVNNCWSICAIRSVFLSYGWKTQYEVFAIFNKDREQIDKIALDKWCLFDMKFVPCGDGDTPRPIFTIALKTNMAESFVLDSYDLQTVQQVWDCFLEIEQNCQTIGEAKLYLHYYVEKLKNSRLALTLEGFKAELKEKDNIAIQYKKLLDKIEQLAYQSVQ